MTVLYAKGSQYSPTRYEEAIIKYFKENGKIENLKLIPVPQPKITTLLAKINRFITRGKGSIGFPVLYYLGYGYWQKRVYKVVEKFSKEDKIDIIHNLTQITYREPGFLWKLDVPFVWGPTGGLGGVSLKILADLSFKQKLFEIIRNTSNLLQWKFKRRIRSAMKRASLIYVFSKKDYKEFSKYNQNVKIMLDSGTNPEASYKIRDFKGGKLNIIWVGQLSERKGLIILIRALEQIKNVNELLNVNILGDGSLKDYYQSEVSKKGLNCVKFLGKIPHGEVKSILELSHVLIHTSYREATTHVVPESLSTGLPVICHDSFGLSIAVTNDCGIKMPLESFDNSVSSLVKNIYSILKNPNIIRELSHGAIRRSHELSWGQMVDEIARDYHKIIESKEAS